MLPWNRNDDGTIGTARASTSRARFSLPTRPRASLSMRSPTSLGVREIGLRALGRQDGARQDGSRRRQSFTGNPCLLRIRLLPTVTILAPRRFPRIVRSLVETCLVRDCGSLTTRWREHSYRNATGSIQVTTDGDGPAWPSKLIRCDDSTRVCARPDTSRCCVASIQVFSTFCTSPREKVPPFLGGLVARF